jgi:hypothetical protein
MSSGIFHAATLQDGTTFTSAHWDAAHAFSGSLNFTSGSFINILSGSLIVNGIQVTSPFNYLVLFYSGSYYAYDMVKSTIISSSPNDLAVPLNAAINDIATSTPSLGKNSIRVLPYFKGPNAVDVSYQIRTPIDFSPIFNKGEAISFYFDARGTKIEAAAPMNMMVNLSNFSGGVFGVEGASFLQRATILFGSIIGQIGGAGTKYPTYGVYVRDMMMCDIQFSYIGSALLDGLFIDEYSYVTGHLPIQGCFSNKFYAGSIGACGRDGCRMVGHPVTNQPLGIQSNTFDFPFLVNNSTGNDITVGPSGSDNTNLNVIIVRAMGGGGGVVDNSGGNWWQFPGGITDPITFGPNALPNIVDLLDQGNAGAIKTRVGLPHKVRGFVGLETFLPPKKAEDAGIVTFSGNGSITAFTGSHNCWAIPSVINVTPVSSAAALNFYVSNISSGSFTLTFTSAPASGSNNVILHYRAEV